MTCRNCGNESKNRYAPKVTVVGDIDAAKATEHPPQPYPKREPNHRAAFHPEMPENFEEVEKVARAMSFEELYEAVTKRKADVLKVINHDLETMTPAIKRLHVLSLVEAANFEPNPLLAMTPDQAIVNLKLVLDREDFNDISSLYPGLKDQVSARYQDLMLKRLSI